MQCSAYSVLQKSVAKSRVLENAIDSRMLIKTTTYSDVQQKPYQFYWHGLFHVTIGVSRSPFFTLLEQGSGSIAQYTHLTRTGLKNIFCSG
ncbi:MAG: hypothetical protein ACK5GN_11720 [Pseudomonadota bacterium]